MPSIFILPTNCAAKPWFLACDLQLTRIDDTTPRNPIHGFWGLCQKNTCERGLPDTSRQVVAWQPHLLRLERAGPPAITNHCTAELFSLLFLLQDACTLKPQNTTRSPHVGSVECHNARLTVATKEQLPSARMSKRRHLQALSTKVRSCQLGSWSLRPMSLNWNRIVK